MLHRASNSDPDGIAWRDSCTPSALRRMLRPVLFGADRNSLVPSFTSDIASTIGFPNRHFACQHKVHGLPGHRDKSRITGRIADLEFRTVQNGVSQSGTDFHQL